MDGKPAVSGVLERSLGILELLADEPGGMSVSAIAQRLNLPPSGAHRLLNELAKFGYVKQDRAHGDYALTIKLASLALSFLGRSGINDIAQPILDQLAQASGELIRLSVVDGKQLVWVAVAQGATSGLRYDPGREQGVIAHLASAAGGQAWLSTMSDEAALTLVGEQGFLKPEGDGGPNAPRTASELLAILAETRQRGYSLNADSFMTGMAAMAVPVRYGGDGRAFGALSIAGPTVRMTREHMEGLAPLLLDAAAELGRASHASQLLRRTSQMDG